MKKILFIDDHLPILQMLQRRFKKLNYEVFTASGSSEAVTLLEQVEIDLVVVDYMMPEVSGFDFLSENLHREIAFILMTAHSSLHLAVEFMKNGGADYIEKPIDVDMLNVKIARALRNRDSVLAEKNARKKAEEEILKMNEALLVEKQKLEIANRQLDLFTSSISHDLRAPLRQISSFTQLIKRKNVNKFDPDSESYFHRISHATQKMDELIQSLLTFSKTAESDFLIEEIDLHELVEDIIHHMRTDDSLKVQFELEELGTVHAAQLPLRQVFVNLIGNAIKYSRNAEAPRVKITSIQKEGQNIISIADNGVGFKMEYADQIFKMFKRLHNESEFEGTGVGLTLVKSIIERHQGSIWAESEPQKGATFSFSLPTPIAVV